MPRQWYKPWEWNMSQNSSRNLMRINYGRRREGTLDFPPDTSFLDGWEHGLINFIDTKPRCHHLKKLTCKWTLRQVFIRVFRLELESVMLVFSTQLCELCFLWVSIFTTEAESKEKHGVWDPMPELTITSPDFESSVDSNTFIMGNPTPESTLTLCQRRLLSPSQELRNWPQSHISFTKTSNPLKR